LEEKKALIVDDMKANRDLLKLLVEHYGFTCDCASDGIEASRLYHSEIYNIILMDLNLPKKDGLSLIVEFRTTANRSSTVPIIVISAFANENTRQECLQAGANEILNKPIDPDALEAILEKVI